jgi:hypothetical protein
MTRTLIVACLALLPGCTAFDVVYGTAMVLSPPSSAAPPPAYTTPAPDPSWLPPVGVPVDPASIKRPQ